MDRNDILFSMFDSSGFGLEVGPSYNPLLPKSRFSVETIDHADAASLREKYRDNASKIEDVDYVSDGRSILEVIGKQERYDFIVASHVIEHVTDIVRAIQDCEALLKPDGRLVLAVPDKRYCFDALRPISTVGQALQAYAERLHRHPPGVLFDHYSLVCAKEAIVWMEPTLDDVHLIHDMHLAKQKFDEAFDTDAYHDVHRWQFTPTSFRLLVKQLRTLGYIQSGEAAFYKRSPGQPGMHEFYICLSKTAPSLDDRDIDLLKQIEGELHEISCGFSGRKPENEVEELRRDISIARRELGETKQQFGDARGKISQAQKELDETKQQLVGACEQIRQLEATIGELLQSTSWKVTAPLRFVRRLFH